MKSWATEFANAADDGAPYAGPLLMAETREDAQRLTNWVRGPNAEVLKVIGPVSVRLNANIHGDTKYVIGPE